MNDKKVAVIGGGAAGLCAARHCTASEGIGGGVTVFEQTSQLGGTWVYTDETDTDQFGLPILTSMYKNLRSREDGYKRKHSIPLDHNSVLCHLNMVLHVVHGDANPFGL